MAQMRTAEDVFIDFCARRSGVLQALTNDVESFFQSCDPNRENLCLYGQPNGSWTVSVPCEEVPPELPEPTIGINFARDGIKRNDWLNLVAVHSDCWLLAVAYYNGARLDVDGRRQLFNDINSLPTCFEIVSGRAVNLDEPAQITKKPDHGMVVGNHHHHHGTIDGTIEAPEAPTGSGEAGPRKTRHNNNKDAGADGGYTGDQGDPCPNCGRLYRTGEFWIQCDFCDRWFDGKCVQMTPQLADQSSRWACPFCQRGTT